MTRAPANGEPPPSAGRNADNLVCLEPPKSDGRKARRAENDRSAAKNVFRFDATLHKRSLT